MKLINYFFCTHFGKTLATLTLVLLTIGLFTAGRPYGWVFYFAGVLVVIGVTAVLVFCYKRWE